jgi:hypothetical protein
MRASMPVMATATAGYSGTPLHRKLGIKAGMTVLAAAVPEGWDVALFDPGHTATVATRPGRLPYDVVVAFAPDLATLEEHLRTLLPRVSEAGRLWLCWPKRSSGVPTDLDDSVVRERGLAAGVVDVKVCAVDATWSGLCFMTRLRDRRA